MWTWEGVIHKPYLVRKIVHECGREVKMSKKLSTWFMNDPFSKIFLVVYGRPTINDDYDILFQCCYK